MGKNYFSRSTSLFLNMFLNKTERKGSDFFPAEMTDSFSVLNSPDIKGVLIYHV